MDPGRAESKRQGLESVINPGGSSDSPSTRVPPSMYTHPQVSCLVIGGGEARCSEVQREEERGGGLLPNRIWVLLVTPLPKNHSGLYLPFTAPKLGKGCGLAGPGQELSSPLPNSPHPKVLPSFELDLLPKHMEPIERICMLTL